MNYQKYINLYENHMPHLAARGICALIGEPYRSYGQIATVIDYYQIMTS